MYFYFFSIVLESNDPDRKDTGIEDLSTACPNTGKVIKSVIAKALTAVVSGNIPIF